jgi:uncharacterized membrane protein YfcA
MSFADRLVLWLHIAFAIFTIGPVTLAISSTPRYIRRRDIATLRYLRRVTAIFTAGSLLVLVFGVALGQLEHDFSHPWLTAALTLFVVALVLLVLIMRDQRRAIRALAPAEAAPAEPVSAGATPPDRRPRRRCQPDLAGHTCTDGVAAVNRGAGSAHRKDFRFL